MFNNRIEFIVSREGKTWSLFVQLPYVRSLIKEGFSSENAVTDCIRRIVLDHRDDGLLHRFILTFQAVESMLRSISEEPLSRRNAVIEQDIASLRRQWDENRWWAPNGFSVNGIKEELRRRMVDC